MQLIRRRIARLFENLIAAGVGALVVCLARGMTPSEIVAAVQANAHKIPDALPKMVQMIFAPGFLG